MHAYNAFLILSGRPLCQSVWLKVAHVHESLHVVEVVGSEPLGDQEPGAFHTLQGQDEKLQSDEGGVYKAETWVRFEWEKIARAASHIEGQERNQNLLTQGKA